MMLRHDLRTDAQICGKSASHASLFVHHGRGVNRVYCFIAQFPCELEALHVKEKGYDEYKINKKNIYMRM